MEAGRKAIDSIIVTFGIIFRHDTAQLYHRGGYMPY